jgi:MoxR-like ATPase
VKENIGNGTLKLRESIFKTRAAIEQMVEGFEPNATYKAAPEVTEYMRLDVVKAFVHALTGQRYYMLGSAGIGKTSFIKKVGETLGYDVIPFNAATASIDDFFVYFVEKNEKVDLQVLAPRFYKRLISDQPKIIFIDELGRAEKGLANTLMELLTEGTLAGTPIKNLVTVIAADNPQGKTYGKMAGLDFSQADRFTTVVLDSKSTPWRRALAEQFSGRVPSLGTENFPEIDLSKVFSTYDTLDMEVREVLNPRVLAYTVLALHEGLPGEWTLPMVNGIRRKLVSRGGEDVTKNVLDRIAAAMGTTNREFVPGCFERAIEFMLKFGQNVYVQGRPGIGKTSYAKAILQERGIRTGYNSAPAMSPADMFAPWPSKEGPWLDISVANAFACEEPWVWILDEICRGDRRTQNAIMEPIQERTLGGQRTRLIATLALNNPREIAGFKLDVGRNDLAQASRFALSVDIDAENIAFGPWLKKEYGEDVATQFVEWWEDDLDDVGRVLCTPRGLERLIELHEASEELGESLPLQWGLPYVNGDYVKVPLVDLHARLEQRPLARLKAIVANVDFYEAELKKGKDEAPMQHSTVHSAFMRAEITSLEAARDVVVRLFAVLDQQHRFALVRQSPERQRFWNGILRESAKLKESAKAESESKAKK